MHSHFVRGKRQREGCNSAQGGQDISDVSTPPSRRRLHVGRTSTESNGGRHQGVSTMHFSSCVAFDGTTGDKLQEFWVTWLTYSVWRRSVFSEFFILFVCCYAPPTRNDENENRHFWSLLQWEKIARTTGWSKLAVVNQNGRVTVYFRAWLLETFLYVDSWKTPFPNVIVQSETGVEGWIFKFKLHIKGSK